MACARSQARRSGAFGRVEAKIVHVLVTQGLQDKASGTGQSKGYRTKQAVQDKASGTGQSKAYNRVLWVRLAVTHSLLGTQIPNP